MPKKRRPANICPYCGTQVEPIRTWQLTSPMPDARGRITVTVMGSFSCPECGHRWRGVISKIKIGGEDIEIETGTTRKKLSGKEKEKRQGEVFEIDIDED